MARRIIMPITHHAHRKCHVGPNLKQSDQRTRAYPRRPSQHAPGSTSPAHLSDQPVEKLDRLTAMLQQHKPHRPTSAI